MACEVVRAEVRACFPTDSAFTEALGILGVRSDPISPEAALMAGRLCRERRQDGSRDRVVAGFLIAAHAQVQADALLTLDRGFYRRYVSGPKLADVN